MPRDAGKGDGLHIEGLAKLNRTLRAAPGRATRDGSAGLYAAAQDIFAVTQDRVPYDLGPLQASGQVSLPEREGNQVVVEIGYGGPATPYALVQHERLDYAHAEGRTAKYLEQPVLEAAPELGRTIERHLRRIFGG